MRSLLLVALLAVLPAPAFAQDKDKEKDKNKKKIEPIAIVKLDRKDPVKYEEIDKIIYKRCVTCHSGPVKEGQFDLASYEGMVKGGRSGQAIIPGKADSSRLYKMAGRTSKPYMPPKGEIPLTPDELALFKLWIDQGAKAPTTIRERPKIIASAPPANVTPVRALAVSPDKSAVVAGRANQIHVYDAGSGAFIRSLINPELKNPDGKAVKAAHLSIVETLAFSPDGKWLASGGFQEVTFWDVQTGAMRGKLTGFAHLVVAIAFSPDGKLMATGGGAPTEDGEIKIYEVGSWKLLTDIKNGHSDQVFGVAFSPDGKKLATCAADKFIKVFDVDTGKFIKSFEGHTHHVMDVGWSADGKLLASGGADNAIKIWDYEKGEQTKTVNKAHGKQITRLHFFGKKQDFVTCSGDGSVKFWSAGNGNVTKNFPASGDFYYAVGISPDGVIVAAGGDEGVVRVYNGVNGQVVRTLYAPGTEPKKK